MASDRRRLNQLLTHSNSELSGSWEQGLVRASRRDTFREISNYILTPEFFLLLVKFVVHLRISSMAEMSSPFRIRLEVAMGMEAKNSFCIHGCGGRVYALVLCLALDAIGVTLGGFVIPSSSARPTASLSLQSADGWVRAGGHHHGVAVKFVKSSTMNVQVIRKMAFGYPVPPSESNWASRHAVIKKVAFQPQQSLAVSFLYFFLLENGIHFHLHPMQ
ncbi:Hypothetical predicted protein [Podarcis lilfordi]|uniref:Uncharacterized protein n=1 Tax=Podarcis lilfordi TaxID=74358 RepID=A0AA35P524_9SAUR|nr:Hypothetical predicted protein [Podarcis lilfordi]